MNTKFLSCLNQTNELLNNSNLLNKSISKQNLLTEEGQINLINKESLTNSIDLIINESLEEKNNLNLQSFNELNNDNIDLSKLSITQSSLSLTQNSDLSIKNLSNKNEQLNENENTKNFYNLIFNELNKFQSYLTNQINDVNELKKQVDILSTQNYLLTNINEEQTKALSDMAITIIVNLFIKIILKFYFK